MFSGSRPESRHSTGMSGLERVVVLVQGLAIKRGQRVPVTRKMCRNPVEDHTDAVAVEMIDEITEIVRGAETACRCEISG